jgi:hypothetical protein
LSTTRSALESSQQLSQSLAPALTKLVPQARALKPALEATQPFFKQTTDPIKNQIRPFTRQVAPTIHHLGQGSKPLAKTTRGLTGAFTHLNRLLNAAAYDPSGSREPYLFWLAWLNHDGNSTTSIQDATGPMARALIILSCTTAASAESVTQTRPFLNTIRQISNPPSSATIAAKGGCS